MNEEQLDRIDSYILHKMDDAEVTAFEGEMSADESLANEVRDTEMIVEALAERERKRQSMEQFKSSYSPSKIPFWLLYLLFLII